MYRYVRHTPLDTGHKYGDVLTDGVLSPTVIEKFLESGILVRITTPPLSEIPSFEKRFTLLSRANINTIEDLTKANPKQVSKLILKSAATVRRWQIEAEGWLRPTPAIEKEDN